MNFSELVKRYRTELYHWSFDLTGTREDAEDLAQEALVKAHQAMPDFRGEAKWSTWLFRIARNTYLDRLKTARHKMRVLERPIPEESQSHLQLESDHPGDNPERKMRSNDIQKDLGTALGKLSDLQREVFVLRHYHGFKLREISAILERSDGTIKKTLFRAIHSLRNSLSPYVQAPSKEV